MEEKEYYRDENLKHEDFVIGTDRSKQWSGMENLCCVLDIEDERAGIKTNKQFLMSFNKAAQEKNGGTPAVLDMPEKFTYDADESSVRMHADFIKSQKFTSPFFEFNVGAKIPQLKNPKHGTPIYVGKDDTFVHVVYVDAEGIQQGSLYPADRHKIQDVINTLDAGKRKIKVKYINIEDDMVTVTVVSIDSITDMKELIYQIGG